MSADPFETTVSSGQTKFDIPPAGNHPAVCIGLVDMGTHEEEYDKTDKSGNKLKNSQGVVETYKKDVRKFLLAWELTSCPVSGKNGVNHVITKDYSLLLSEKAGFRKMLLSWFGRAPAEGAKFSPRVLLGKKCLCNVKNGTSAKGYDYANLDAVTAPVQGLTIPDARRQHTIWSFADGFAALDKIDWLPKKLYGNELKDEIHLSHEGRKIGGGPAAPAAQSQTATPAASAPHAQQPTNTVVAAPAAEPVYEGDSSIPF